MNVKRALTVATTLAGLMAAGAPAWALSKCLERDGRCMAVTVNGQAAQKLSKRTKTLLKGLESVSYMVRDTRYEVALPVAGALALQADRSKDSGDWFGEGRSFETMVVPLDQVDLTTREEVTTSNNVRVGGAAPLVMQNVIEGNRLPPGRYLLSITLSGSGNWDRMTLYVEVAE
jgi:hypothetical protein